MNKITLKNLIITAVIIGVLVIPGVIVYLTQGENGGKFLSSQEAGEKAIKYINENFLQGKERASLMSIETENEFYKLKLKIQGQEADLYITIDGKLLFFQAPVNLDQEPTIINEDENNTDITANHELTIGNFSISEDEICEENGKPVVYFFGSTNCSHCLWQHPVLKQVLSNFGENIVFHDNNDSDDDTEIFSKYSSGYVPTLVLGCKYYRIGSGEQVGEEQESKNLTALICKLTDNQPNEVCGSVQELINQIQ